MQIQGRADRGGRGDLDRAPGPAADGLAVDLPRVAPLHEPAFLPARDGAEDHHHVLEGDGNGVSRISLSISRRSAQPQVVDQEGHQVAVARVADGAVVQLADAAVERFAERAQAAGGVERLVADAVQGKRLQAFQRQDLDQAAFVDRLAGIAVLVDQAVGRPGEVVVQGVGGKLRQGADAHVDGSSVSNARVR